MEVEVEDRQTIQQKKERNIALLKEMNAIKIESRKHEKQRKEKAFKYDRDELAATFKRDNAEYQHAQQVKQNQR